MSIGSGERKKSAFEYLRLFSMQCLLALLFTIGSLEATSAIVGPVNVCYREMPSHESSSMADFVKQLAADGRFPSQLVAPTGVIFGSHSIKDYDYACGIIGELAPIILCLLLPSRFFRCGCYSFAVLPPLIFILLVLGSYITRIYPSQWCDTYAYYLGKEQFQTSILAASAVLFSLRAQGSGLRTTSLFDGMMCSILVVLFFVALSIFDQNYAWFSRLG